MGIFYGSSTGDTERVATLICNKIGHDKASVYDILDSCTDDLNKYPFLILGISTLGIGKIQDDWNSFMPKLKSADLSGKKIALFGLGDQESYPDNFVNALGILYDELANTGCLLVGDWSVDGYVYFHSSAERNGKFVGLVLDERNQPELTDERVISWLKSIDL